MEFNYVQVWVFLKIPGLYVSMQGQHMKTPWLKQEQLVLTELTRIYPGINVPVLFL